MIIPPNATLPQIESYIDDQFIRTWYEAQMAAADNILDANVLWALLKTRGRLIKQVGKEWISKKILYGKGVAAPTSKTGTFTSGELQLHTMAMWRWKYTNSHVQRNIFDDQVNVTSKEAAAGYVRDRLTAAREALVELFNTNLSAPMQANETGEDLQGFNDMIPPFEFATTGTYGNIARPTAYAEVAQGVYAPSAGNTWWGPKYKALSPNPDVNLIDDMRSLYNGIGNNVMPPNAIVTDQYLYELYEDFGLGKAQIVKRESGGLVDLGFTVLLFNGKDMVWDNSIQYNGKHQMLMLNLDYIDLTYDPNMWFAMGNWKEAMLNGDKIAHILCACNLVTDQLRRHGRLYEA